MSDKFELVFECKRLAQYDYWSHLEDTKKKDERDLSAHHTYGLFVSLSINDATDDLIPEILANVEKLPKKLAKGDQTAAGECQWCTGKGLHIWRLQLNFNGQRFTDKAVKDIISWAKEKPNDLYLEALKMSHNMNITDDCIPSIVELTYSIGSHFQLLDLSGNRLRNQGVYNLSMALARTERTPTGQMRSLFPGQGKSPFYLYIQGNEVQDPKQLPAIFRKAYVQNRLQHKLPPKYGGDVFTVCRDSPNKIPAVVAPHYWRQLIDFSVSSPASTGQAIESPSRPPSLSPSRQPSLSRPPSLSPSRPPSVSPSRPPSVSPSRPPSSTRGTSKSLSSDDLPDDNVSLDREPPSIIVYLTDSALKCFLPICTAKSLRRHHLMGGVLESLAILHRPRGEVRFRICTQEIAAVTSFGGSIATSWIDNLISSGFKEHKGTCMSKMNEDEDIIIITGDRLEFIDICEFRWATPVWHEDAFTIFVKPSKSYLKPGSARRIRELSEDFQEARLRKFARTAAS